ncbi:endo-alpha-1,4-polygalactosaminidase (GH114 family) [Pedobacter cryoconitis]|uniref:Endo-alpha-1,4-polygalactosaminidase (GH114 family) n=1 Tax=Pedobacter cryoconitis TaxID=188932 RepID=A0A7W8ZR30_9SPHI|nr:endo alpha-1,4 polygalactosaminidase [Pedobacter cryoconitis]MBB5638636.1 endo-alpha-1,4-polygalactosaminidase (GH114 family) [Pedobacter cryoconitis]MBB6274367.1 endo-alpha-1,4-polygalactosaminidase (GH114 family) [Pedobacter cryoconitis]
MKNTILVSMMLFALAACQKESRNNGDNVPNNAEPDASKVSWWQPKPGVTFDWDLDDLKSGDTFTAEVVDVDAFTTTAEQVAALHAQGKKVIAYVSAGTIENDRPDANLLPKEVIGKVYPEWPKERWLDIRQLEKLKPWLNSRISRIVNKGFDAIEPDNLDGFNAETGFDISINDTKLFCDLLIKLAHDKGLGIGQKNVPELSAEYSKKFDWVLTEDAFQQGWQNDVKPYITQNKPVFAVEYTDSTSQSTFTNSVCPAAQSLKYSAILKNRNLDKWVYKCK